MIGIILVSHSEKITDGIVEMINEMVGDAENVQIHSAGGTGDGRLGTNTVMIMEKIAACDRCQHILIFNDIGSALLSSEMAKDLVEDVALQQKIQLVEAPLVEGAFAAAVQASVTNDLSLIFKEVAAV